jgi:hypothetical protein
MQFLMPAKITLAKQLAKERHSSSADYLFSFAQ